MGSQDFQCDPLRKLDGHHECERRRTIEPDSWKLKARIVFRGDDIRDQTGMSAVFEELFASAPSSLEGLNTVIGFGLLESHGVTTSDAIKAYTQATLKSRNRTFVFLPPELVPASKRDVI